MVNRAVKLDDDFLARLPKPSLGVVIDRERAGAGHSYCATHRGDLNIELPHIPRAVSSLITALLTNYTWGLGCFSLRSSCDCALSSRTFSFNGCYYLLACASDTKVQGVSQILMLACSHLWSVESDGLRQSIAKNMGKH